jgi:hypothetical protein
MPGTVALLLALLAACRPAQDRAQYSEASLVVFAADSSTKNARQDSILTAAMTSHADPSLVRPAEPPPSVEATCDSASSIMRVALALAVHRADGPYRDSFHQTPRVGCRLTANGSFKGRERSGDPVGALVTGFADRGWRSDIRYSADGPDGSFAGMRFRDQLCILSGSWDGGDDSDPDTTHARAAQDAGYAAVIECARDVLSNADAGVPDSVWSIAKEAGLDSIYAISRNQSRPYLEADFDGDGVVDAAVLIEHRATGKVGVAIVRRGPRHITILGAGVASSGPDDLEWVNELEIYHRGVTNDLTIGDRPTIPLVGDALWVGRRDSVSAFFVWTGQRFAFEAHKRNRK